MNNLSSGNNLIWEKAERTTRYQAHNQIFPSNDEKNWVKVARATLRYLETSGSFGKQSRFYNKCKFDFLREGQTEQNHGN